MAYYYGTRGRVTWHSLIFPGIKIHIGQIIGSSIQSFFEISDNDIEAPKALDVQLRLPERGKFCFGGHFKRWQKEFSPVLSPYKLVKSKCQFCEVPNGFLACKVVSHH